MTMTISTAILATTIDVREIAPHDRHTLIFNQFDALEPGQALQVVNDHDPQGLHRQFEKYLPGKYDWAYLENGPELWRVQISKLVATNAQVKIAGSSCCSGGACCG